MAQMTEATKDKIRETMRKKRERKRKEDQAIAKLRPIMRSLVNLIVGEDHE